MEVFLYIFYVVTVVMFVLIDTRIGELRGEIEKLKQRVRELEKKHKNDDQQGHFID